MKSSYFQLAACAGLLGITCLSADRAAGDILAHWSFDETAGSTTLVDSVNGYNGTAVGATAGATGQIGGAWDFDDANQEYIDLTSHLSNFSGLTQGTISAWFNSSDSTGRKVIIGAYNSTAASDESVLYLQSMVHYDTRDSTGTLPGESGNLGSTSSMADGNWHHVAVNFNSGEAADSIYVDGVLQETEDEPFWGDMTSALDGMAIGRNVDSGSGGSGGQWHFPGLIDDIQIYDEPLPLVAIEKIYNDGLLGISTQVTSFDLTVEVDTTTGLMTFINDTVFDFEVDSYQITSSSNSLSPSGWSSFEDQDLEGGGTGSGWAELSAAPNELVEAIPGGYVFANNSTLGLGTGFDTVVGVQDLVFAYHVQGEPAGSMATAEVIYVSSDADFDGSGEINGRDFLVWQRGFGLSEQVDKSNGDANGDGTVDGGDLAVWDLQYGISAPLATTRSVPEPAGMFLLAIGAMAVLSKRLSRSASCLLCLCIISNTASADAFKDRQYLLGDDPLEGAIVGNTVGIASSSSTFDSVGVNLTAFPAAADSGAFQDLTVGGAPSYVDVSAVGTGRPGAGVGDKIGARFDGSSDRLSQAVNFASPNRTWNLAAFWPEDLIKGGYDVPSLAGIDTTGDGLYTPANPHNMSGLFSTAIQAWVFPEGTENGHGEREDILRDGTQKGLFITDTDDGGADGGPDVWGHHYAGLRVSDTPVVRNQWSHVQQRATGGISVLYVNGIAVDAVAATFNNTSLELSIGSDDGGSGNFFEGVLDNIEMSVEGDTSSQPATATNTELGYLGGADWGDFDLGEDNDFVVQQLAGIPEADVDMDGDVDPNDITAFIPFWLLENEVDGILIGDLNTRAQGDLNFDGITDLDDAVILREALIASPFGAVFDLSVLVSPVPEPSTLLHCFIGTIGIALSERRRRGMNH